jgi:hypothetical protein
MQGKHAMNEIRKEKIRKEKYASKKYVPSNGVRPKRTPTHASPVRHTVARKSTGKRHN